MNDHIHIPTKMSSIDAKPLTHLIDRFATITDWKLYRK